MSSTSYSNILITVVPVAIAMTPSSSTPRNFATLCIHPSGEHEHDPVSGAVIPPISLSTTFAQVEPAKPVGVSCHNRILLTMSRILSILVQIIQRVESLRTRLQFLKTENTVNKLTNP